MKITEQEMKQHLKEHDEECWFCQEYNKQLKATP